ncbi:MAG TPA: hypothetical protein VKV40_14270 [Ktedonobacteraceae bacterium]|nr:hypothetical protein [Ktedonobacteraceae bacterium]
MSETNLEQTEVTQGPDIDRNDQGELHLGEAPEPTAQEVVPPSPPVPTPVSAATRAERPGTAEHLAARRPVPPLDVESAEVKQQLAALRIEVTRLLTGLRHEGVSAQETADELIPLLDLGPFLQWSPVLIPFLLEIDRAGNLIPVWLKIIDQGDPTDLPPDTNLSETEVGKARRIAILMLGNYKSAEFSEKSASPIGFRPGRSAPTTKSDLYKVLGRLALDPNTSLYATQALVKQGNSPAMQTLVSALKEAEGWAKVDIIEACLEFNQPSFYDFLLASGFERASGLESYIAIPIYRSLPLERYLRGEGNVTPRLSQQAALVFAQVVQDSMKQPSAETDEVPVLFEGNLPALASALFDGARRNPSWQSAVALHRLGLLLGRYWGDIARGTLKDARIVQPVAESLLLMPEVERWMNGPGRDVLLEALSNSDEETAPPIIRVLGDLREPRAIAILLARVDTVTQLEGRKQASSVGLMCETLGKMGDLRAVPSLFGLAGRVLSIPSRAGRPKRKENLPVGDADIPASIVYGAIVRALGQLADRSTVDFLLHASNDFDPYVRTQALEALKRVDEKGEMMSSRLAAREALNDPADSVVRAACQLVAQYRDREAIPQLQNLAATRMELAPAAYDALRQLG